MEVPLTPLALVERGVWTYPERIAVADDGQAWTYAHFARRAGLLAAGLRALGVREGDRVALLAANTARALECYTGVPAAGAVLVPLNTRLSADDYAYILDHSASRVLIADAAYAEAVAPVLADRPHVRLVVQGPTPPGADDYEALLSAAARPVAIAPDGVDERAPITLNYTSGTTARPKGVLVSHRGAYLNAANMVFALRLRREDVHLHVAPMFHANGCGLVRTVHGASGRTGVCLGEGTARQAGRSGRTLRRARLDVARAGGFPAMGCSRSLRSRPHRRVAMRPSAERHRARSPWWGGRRRATGGTTGAGRAVARRGQRATYAGRSGGVVAWRSSRGGAR
jgi:acyl-CoA synthetase (AMP-forming)/AMP-acid ligase II